METKEITVRVIDDDGRPVVVPAVLMVCPDCQGETFFVYTVEGHDHLQCADCHTTFCRKGSCGGGV